jgi:thiamine transport system permease protein
MVGSLGCNKDSLGGTHLGTRTLARHVVLAFPVLLLLVFLVYPVLNVIVQGFLSEGGSSFIDVVSSPLIQNTIQFTFLQAFLSTLLVVVLGLPGAFILARLNFKGKHIVRALMIIPFVLPPIVVVIGFNQMFGANGVIDSILMWIQSSSVSVFNLATGVPGIILAHTFYNIPLVVLIVAAALERLNPEIEESAELLGATKYQRFKRITLPHILPSLFAAAILTFLFCFMSFPIILAFGQGRYNTIEVEIYQSLSIIDLDYGTASSLTLIQILITMVLAYTYVRLGKQSSNSGEGTSSIKTIQFDQYLMGEKIFIVGYVVLLVFLIIGPIITIFRAAVYNPNNGQYTLDGFTNLLVGGSRGGFTHLVNSMFYSGLATLFAVILGIPLAQSMKSRRRIVPTLASTMILLPLGISSISVAYGLISTIAVPTGLVKNPWPIIVVAQTILGLPFSARAIEIAMRNIDSQILDQADSLGASKMQKLFFVELPLLAPGILVGGVFAFAMAIGEMSATYLIALPQNYTLAVAIYDNFASRHFVEAGAAALILVMVCVFASLLMERISEGSTTRGAL